jgi:hypothetical protein
MVDQYVAKYGLVCRGTPSTPAKSHDVKASNLLADPADFSIACKKCVHAERRAARLAANTPTETTNERTTTPDV